MESVSARGSSCCCVCGTCDNDGNMCSNLWSKLPDDLITELMCRIPKEALLEFRCVSKAYNFMISECFLPKLAASAPVSGFVFQWERSIFPELECKRTGLPRFYIPPTYHYGYVTEVGGGFAAQGGKLVESYLSLLPFVPKTDDFLGCFNGFFLVRNISSLPIQYYVCNPATKQCVSIPLNSAHLEGDSFAGLAFDPLEPPPHNFKIVRVVCCPETSSSLDQQPHKMDVFSSAMGKWVNYLIPLEIEILEFKRNRRSIYVHGVFYMLSMNKYLLCFHLHTTNDNTLKTRAVKLPPRSKDDCVGLFDTSNKCLYYACKIDNDLLVWTFDVNNEASPWTLKYNINISGRRCISYPHMRMHSFIFSVDLSTEIIYAGCKYKAYIYDTKNNQAEPYGRIEYGIILNATSLCFYPYSCCLVKLSEQFSLSRQVLDLLPPLSCLKHDRKFNYETNVSNKSRFRVRTSKIWQFQQDNLLEYNSNRLDAKRNRLDKNKLKKSIGFIPSTNIFAIQEQVFSNKSIAS